MSTAVSMKVRPRAADDLLRELAERLTERDRYVLRMLDDHRVLTTAQVADLGFASIRRAQDRLDHLHGLRAVDRFRPFRATGSAPYHWVLDWGGAAVRAAERDAGADLAAMTWRKERALAVARSMHLEHRVGANGFFTALIREGRRQRALGKPGDGLALWWSARECDREFATGHHRAPAHPDGAGRWSEDRTEIAWLLEWDCGTETLGQLADKLPAHGRLMDDIGRAHGVWVLFRFPSPRREAEARRAMEKPSRVARLRVATAVLAPGESPAEAVWLPLVEPARRRLRLIDLAGLAQGHSGIAADARRTAETAAFEPGSDDGGEAGEDGRGWGEAGEDGRGWGDDH